jgi:hypothetical protein
MQIAAVDGASKKRAPRHTDDGAGRAVATVVQRASDQPTDSAPDDQASGPVTAVAVIMPIPAAPDRVVKGKAPLWSIVNGFKAPLRIIADRFKSPLRGMADSFMSPLRSVVDGFMSQLRSIVDRFMSPLRRILDRFRSLFVAVALGLAMFLLPAMGRRPRWRISERGRRLQHGTSN